jgi:hypothetical protein
MHLKSHPNFYCCLLQTSFLKLPQLMYVWVHSLFGSLKNLFSLNATAKLKRLLQKLNSRGNAAMECALILPLLLAMFFGMIVVVNYIMVARKLDSAVNDISALIAREGRIATLKQLNAQGHVEFVNGRQFIETQISTLIPILTFPLNTAVYDYDVKMVGQPLWAKIDAPTNPNNLRLMWQQGKVGALHAYGFTYSIAGSNVTAGGPGITGTTPVASITQTGQSQIIVGLAAPYNQTATTRLSFFGGTEKFGMDFLQLIITADFAKFAAYPVRVFPAVNATSFNIPYNDMNICTDCDLRSDNMSGGGALERQRCTATGDPYGLDRNVSGCVFD